MMHSDNSPNGTSFNIEYFREHNKTIAYKVVVETTSSTLHVEAHLWRNVKMCIIPSSKEAVHLLFHVVQLNLGSHSYL